MESNHSMSYKVEHNQEIDLTIRRVVVIFILACEFKALPFFNGLEEEKGSLRNK